MSSKQQASPASQVKFYVTSKRETTNEPELTICKTAERAEALLLDLWSERQPGDKYAVDFYVDQYEIDAGYQEFRDDVPPSVLDEMDMMIESLQHAAKALRENDKENGNATSNA